MFTNTKLTLDIARNVSTIDITIYGRGATRHDTTIRTGAKFCVSTKNFIKNYFCPLRNLVYIRNLVKQSIMDACVMIVTNLKY